MTIISNYNYTYSNSNRRSGSFSRNYRKRHSLRRHKVGNYLGRVKIFIIPLSFIIVLGSYWLMIFGSNITLDYKICQLKKDIAALDKNTNILRGEALEMMSDEKLIAWAQTHHFVPIEKLGYLNIEPDNLAQANQINF